MNRKMNQDLYWTFCRSAPAMSLLAPAIHTIICFWNIRYSTTLKMSLGFCVCLYKLFCQRVCSIFYPNKTHYFSSSFRVYFSVLCFMAKRCPLRPAKTRFSGCPRWWVKQVLLLLQLPVESICCLRFTGTVYTLVQYLGYSESLHNPRFVISLRVKNHPNPLIQFVTWVSLSQLKSTFTLWEKSFESLISCLTIMSLDLLSGHR